MKKKVLSLVVAAVMMLSAFSGTALAAGMDDKIDAGVEKVGNILDKLSDDASIANTVAFDRLTRTEQLAALGLKAEEFKNGTVDYALLVRTEIYNSLTGNDKKFIEYYFKTLDICADDSLTGGSYDLLKADFELIQSNPAYDTEGDTLSETLDKIDPFMDVMNGFFAAYEDSVLREYEGLTDDEIEAYIAPSATALLAVVFSVTGAELENNFADLVASDEAKKTLAMLVGAEFVTTVQEEKSNLISIGKEWAGANKQLVIDLAYELLEEDTSDSEKAFDAAKAIYNEVLADYSALLPQVVKEKAELFINDDLAEALCNAIDSDGLFRQIWINLVLSRFVQLEVGTVKATTVEKDSALTRVSVSNNTSAAFVFENIEAIADRVGIEPATLTIPSDTFDVVCTDADGNVISNVTYNDGTFTVTRNSSEGTTYDAYLSLYRMATSTDDSNYKTFIESYPVTISNPAKQGSSSGSGLAKVSAPYANGDQSNVGGNIEEGTEITLSASASASIYYTTDGTTPTKNSSLYEAGTRIVLQPGQVLKAIAYKNGISSVVSTWVIIKKPGTDIGEVLEAADHIAYLVGYEDGTFRPDNNMTRAEAATMFARLMKERMQSGVRYPSTFSDVPADAWYADYIGYMQKYGVINGYEDGTFRPDNSITRAEFVAIAGRMIVMSGQFEADFSDVSAEHWAYKYVAFATSNKWVNGYEDNSFRPDNKITRAEVATVVNNMLSRRADEAFVDANLSALTVFGDVVKSHWAYYNILEATNAHNYEASEGKEAWK